MLPKPDVIKACCMFWGVPDFDACFNDPSWSQCIENTALPMGERARLYLFYDKCESE